MSVETRRRARDSVYKLVFEFLFNKRINLKSLTISCSANIPDEDVNYIKDVYLGVVDNYEVIKDYITKFSEGFSFDRIYKTDLAALLISVYEMLFMKDIPKSVSIAEAVDLVKKYSTPKSSSFVNGVLSSILKDIKLKSDG